MLGILAIAALSIYLAARYRHICEEDERGRVWVEPTRDPDWAFPSKWRPTARTHLGRR